MKLVIIDYGSGNTKSVQFALQRLGYKAYLSHRIEEIETADKVIFPGVGEAKSAMKKLRESTLDLNIPKLKQPVLGICLGMQLLCNYTEEGNTKGLGIFDLNVVKFNNNLKVPQIGWNCINNLHSELFKDISENEFMYAVHSYYAPICDETIAESNYGINYSSALHKDNFYGVQFHPEKSSIKGEQVLKNFLEL